MYILVISVTTKGRDGQRLLEDFSSRSQFFGHYTFLLLTLYESLLSTNGDSHCLCLLFRPHFPQKYIAHSIHHDDESLDYD